MLQVIFGSFTRLVGIGLVDLGVFAILLVLIIKYDLKTKRGVKGFGTPPVLPILGNAHSLMGPHEHLIPTTIYWTKLYGTAFIGYIANDRYVFISSPSHVEKVLSSTVHINKSVDYRFLESWLGTGLLTASREKWFHRRKLLTPTLHFKILEDYLPVFNEQAKVLNFVLEEQRAVSEVFDICHFLTNCTLDVMCETVMGVKIGAQLGGETEYVSTVCGMTKVILEKAMNPFYRKSSDFLWKFTESGRLETKYRKVLHAFTRKIIQERKELRKRELGIGREENSISETGGYRRRKAFLDLLLDLQESANLSDEDVREEVDTFMFEGHDTTSANLFWTLLLLACNPECQQLVHEEIDRVFGGDLERDITLDDLRNLKYLECCLKEALRLYPSVPYFFRVTEEDLQLDETRTIPKGAYIAISTYMLHRHPETFPDPEKFDPLRFTPENSVGRHPYAYVPFSAGPRNCIGQKFAMLEGKIIMANLMRKFRFEPVDTVDTVMPIPNTILRPKNGIRVRVLRRN